MRERLVGRDATLRALVAQVRGSCGVLLTGPAGVGKSRLVEELLHHPMLARWATARFVGSEPVRPVAFGALFAIMPPTGSDDRAQLLSQLRSTLLEEATGRRLLVAVDDAHLLDDASAAFLAELHDRGDLVLAMTARAGRRVPSPLHALLRTGRLDRTSVEPLDRRATSALVEDLLGEPVSGPLATELFELGGGLPLLTRELVLDARSSGAIAGRDGCWHRVRPLRSGPRVQELVLERTASLPAGARAVLDLIALADPLDAGFLDDAEGAWLDELEARRLVRLGQTAGRLLAQVEHPLVAEGIIAALPTRRRVALLQDLVARSNQLGHRRRGEALRAAGWSLAAGRQPGPELAVAAAEEALAAFDLGRAGDLARQALVPGDRVDALAVLATVRRLQGRPPDACDAAERGLARSSDDEVYRARCAETLALVHTHHLGDPAGAVTLLRQTAATMHQPAVADRLGEMAGRLEGVLGSYPQVIASSRAALADQDLDDLTRFGHLENVAYAQTIMGRLHGIDDVLDETFALAARLGVGEEMLDMLWALRAGVYVQRGRLAEGERVIGAHLERCRRDGVLHVATAAIHLQLLAHRGARTLRPLAEHVLDGGAGADVFGVRPIALGTAAWDCARRGDGERARALLAEVPADLDDDRTLPFVAAARTALLAHEGEPDQAAGVAVEAGTRALASTHVAFGIVALHAGVGCGRHATLAELLRSATADVDGALMRTMADHACAVRDGDATALVVVASTLAAMGARPHAALAFAQAAALEPPGSRAAPRLSALARLWADVAESSPSPVPQIDEDLTARELDVAWRAAAGATSRSIAEELYISVRTVDNHLRHTYQKLDVGGRDGLAAVLHPMPAPEDLQQVSVRG